MPTLSNPKVKNKKAQQFYNWETSYLAYVVEIQEINLWSEKILLDDHLPSPLEYIEEGEGDSTLQANAPPYTETLVKSKQHTP